MKDWRTIEGYPEYRVSSEGDIESCKNNRHGVSDEYHAIRQRVNPQTGYKQCSITDGEKVKTLNVHREVAKAFIPNPENYGDVNHIDGNKQNNNVDNLEWCSRSDNIKHAFRTGLHKNHLTPEIMAKGRKLGVPKAIEATRKPIRIVETGEEFRSINDCARTIHGNQQNIVKCLKGLRHTHKGLHFEYIDKD